MKLPCWIRAVPIVIASIVYLDQASADALSEGAVLLPQFLKVVESPAGAPPPTWITKWRVPFKIVPSGRVPAHALRLLQNIARDFPDLARVDLHAEVVTDPAAWKPRDPLILIYFLDDSNAAMVADLFAKRRIPLMQPGDVTDGIARDRLCHAYTAASRNGEIVQSNQVIGVNFRLGNFSAFESITSCIYNHLFFGAGLRLSDAIDGSILSTTARAPLPTGKDLVFLRTLYDTRLPTGPMSPATEAMLPRIIADAILSDETPRASTAAPPP